MCASIEEKGKERVQGQETLEKKEIDTESKTKGTSITKHPTLPRTHMKKIGEAKFFSKAETG